MTYVYTDFGRSCHLPANQPISSTRESVELLKCYTKSLAHPSHICCFHVDVQII